MRHRRVARQHLQDEQMQRAHRPELAFPPDMPRRPESGQHRFLGQILFQIVGDAREYT